MTAEMKPCPKCGDANPMDHDAKHYEDEHQWNCGEYQVKVECLACGHSVEAVAPNSTWARLDAIEKWNEQEGQV